MDFAESSKDTVQDLSGINQPQLRESGQSYQILEVRLDADLNQVAKRWTECHRQFPGHSLHGDPEWIEQRFQHEKDKVRLFCWRAAIKSLAQFRLCSAAKSLPANWENLSW